jgi:hypothetical protein
MKAIVQSIRTSQKLMGITQTYRTLLETDKDKASDYKRECGGFMPVAIVNGKRKRENVIAVTGLVMCDFDHVPTDRLEEVRKRVNTDPHTLVSYVTLSGKGLRVLAKYEMRPSDTFIILEAENYYRQVFKGVNQHYEKLTGCEHDAACKDLCRLSFPAYDPEAYYQPQSTPFSAAELSIVTVEERKRLREEKKRKNKALFRISEVYRTQIEPSLRQKDIEYAPGKHNDYVMRVGYQCNKYGFEQDDVREWACQQFSDYHETADVINSCFEKTEEHGMWANLVRKSGKDSTHIPSASRKDILDFLNDRFEMRRNLVLGCTEVREKNPAHEGIDSFLSHNPHTFLPVTDEMVHSMAIDLETERGLSTQVGRIYETVHSRHIPEYDPLLTYLKELPEWIPDKDPDYLGELADTVKIIDDDPNATDLWRRCLKKWFVAMLVGWTQANKGNHTVLTFIGEQGTYKSTWMMNLMPPQLSEYFKVKQNSGDLNKDDIIAMSRYGLILHEELDAMTARENNHLKSIVTAKNSHERKAYHREEMRRENIASLCATGNNDRFLSNDDGSRRMLVFRVEVVKPPIDSPFNYEGIYAQAYSLMKSGFQYYFTPEEQAELEQHNRQFQMVDMEEEMLSLWVRKPEPWETPIWLRNAQICEALTARSNCHFRFNPNKIGRILAAQGFVRTKVQGYYGFKIILRDYEEVLRYQKELALKAVETI